MDSNFVKIENDNDMDNDISRYSELRRVKTLIIKGGCYV